MQIAMQQIGDPETSRKLQQRAGRAVVADPPLGPGGVQDQIGVAQQALDRRTRHRTLCVMVEDDPALPVGERHETDPDPVAVRYRLLQIGLRGQLLDAPVEGLGCNPRHVRGNRVFRCRFAEIVADICQRERQHLVPQRKIERRQAIQSEQPDDRAQGQSVDKEREQYEAGGEDGNDILDVGIDVGVLGHRQRQRQRDRTTQPAPGDGKFVGGADRLGEFEELERRHQHEQNGDARGQRCRDHNQQKPQIREVNSAQQPRHKRGGANENQRARPEARLLPDPLEIPPIVGCEPDACDGARGEPGADDCDNARHLKQLAHEIDDIR